jgi:RNase adaptor protein for sRNA GlmZ degradation
LQLILVSGLSGAGKSIALDVLEDGGYYCVDNLPATLLEDVVRFLADAGHERAAVSVDARSAALAALPESVARLKSGGADCRVLFLEASAPALVRRFTSATASTRASCSPRCCATGSATSSAWAAARSPFSSSPSPFATAFRWTQTG